MLFLTYVILCIYNQKKIRAIWNVFLVAIEKKKGNKEKPADFCCLSQHQLPTAQVFHAA